MTEVGLVFVRSSGAPRTEPFFNQLLGGIEEALDDAGASLLVRMVATQKEEIEHYRRWRQTDALNAVVIKDLAHDDPRPGALNEIEMPFVVLGDVAQADRYAAIVYVDNASAMRDALSVLVDLGHRRIVRVAGPKRFVHTRLRTAQFMRLAADADVQIDVLCGDYTEADGARLTERALAAHERPTAIIFDNDLMACGGLRAAHRLGVAVPGELSLLAFDDSARCRLAEPPISAVSYDLHALGLRLGRAALIAGSREAPIREPGPAPKIVLRGTTEAPGRRGDAHPLWLDNRLSPQ